MKKFLAVLNVIAWSGFWAFGYLALSADVSDTRQILIAGILAAAGFLGGTFIYLRLSRE